MPASRRSLLIPSCKYKNVSLASAHALLIQVYDEELAEVERRVRIIADAAVDAVIVQVRAQTD